VLSVTYIFPVASKVTPIGLLNLAAVPIPFAKPKVDPAKVETTALGVKDKESQLGFVIAVTVRSSPSISFVVIE
jgi:hypothetical protein